MKTRLMAGALLLLWAGLALGADDRRSDTIRKSFSAGSGGRLVIETDRGNVTVEGGDGSEVEVEVLRKVVRGSEAKAAELMARHQVSISQEGDTVRVTADLKGEDRGRLRWGDANLEVSIRARVPREFGLEAVTAGGSVAVARMKGELSVRTAGGSLRLEELSGRIHGRTAGGSIHGSELAGVVDVSTSGGGITLQSVSEGKVRAVTSGGSLRLTGLAAPTEARTSGGSITFETAATPFEASTSGGSITGTLTSAPTDGVVLKTSAGSISLTLPAESGFQLDASASAGSVRSEFPVVTTESRSEGSLRGPVNGGGPTLRLRASAGSIRVKKG